MPIPLFAGLLVSSSMAQSHPDALKLLSNTTKPYLDASSYRVEAVQEHSWSNDFQLNWEKELLVAVVGPDGKYCYEATGGAGGSILVSDGKTHWNYHTLARAYTQTAASSDHWGKNRFFYSEEISVRDAKRLLTDIVMLPSQVQSAILLADEAVVINRTRFVGE